LARRKKAFPKLSGDEAVAALRWLVARGTIGVGHITDALKRRQNLVKEIRERLAALGAEGVRLLKGGPFPISAKRPPAKRRRRKASPAAKKAWALQGAYMGSVRALSKANRLKIRAVREKSGVRAAIAAAKKLAK
jgi:hypothetical protein